MKSRLVVSGGVLVAAMLLLGRSTVVQARVPADSPAFSASLDDSLARDIVSLGESEEPVPVSNQTYTTDCQPTTCQGASTHQVPLPTNCNFTGACPVTTCPQCPPGS